MKPRSLHPTPLAWYLISISDVTSQNQAPDSPHTHNCRHTWSSRMLVSGNADPTLPMTSAKFWETHRLPETSQPASPLSPSLRPLIAHLCLTRTLPSPRLLRRLSRLMSQLAEESAPHTTDSLPSSRATCPEVERTCRPLSCTFSRVWAARVFAAGRTFLCTSPLALGAPQGHADTVFPMPSRGPCTPRALNKSAGGTEGRDTQCAIPEQTCRKPEGPGAGEW